MERAGRSAIALGGWWPGLFEGAAIDRRAPGRRLAPGWLKICGKALFSLRALSHAELRLEGAAVPLPFPWGND